jgi:2-methylcitrate dehydratase PrpD
MIQELIKRIKKSVIEEAAGKETDYPNMTLVIRMKNGRSYTSKVQPSRGSPLNPLSNEEIVNKFLDCASMNYPKAEVEQILETVMKIEKLRDITELVRLTA